MSRVAKVAGGIAFAITLVELGLIVWALLSIRSPLPGGQVAPGPEPTAYALGAAAVLAGAAFVGAVVMLAGELVVRVWRWRRSS